MAITPPELKESVKGLLSFPVTPFTRENKIDLQRYREHVGYMASENPGALFVCGGTGEFFSLGLDEYRELVKAAVDEIDGRIPLIAGVGYGTKLAIAFAQAAEEAGADGIMVMPPYLLQAEQRGLIAHYKAVAQSTSAGVILYQRDNAVFQPESVKQLSDIPNVIGFKDGYGDIERLFRIRLAVGDRLVFINGMPTAELSAPGFLGNGVRYYSSAVFNFVPEISHAFYKALIGQDDDEIERLMEGFYLPFAKLRDQVKGYAVSLIKAGVTLRHGSVGPARAPLVNPTPEHLEQLETVMEMGLAMVSS